MRSLTLAVLVVAMLLAWHGRAAADPSALPRYHDALETPRTVTMTWCETPSAPDAPSSLWIGEWSRSAHAWTSKTKLRELELCRETTRIARTRDAVFVVRGGFSGDDTPVEILRLEHGADGRLVEKASIELAAGFLPSLDASDDAVVVASYTGAGTRPTGEPLAKMHVRVLDPRTLAVVASRTLRGQSLLRVHPTPEVACRAVAVLGKTVFVGLPDETARLATFDVEGLRPLAERALPKKPSEGFERTMSVIVTRRGASVTTSFTPSDARPSTSVREAAATLP